MPDAEFHLLVAACRAAIDGRPMDARLPGIRWNRLLALANRHRVEALCWNALRPFAGEMPEAVATALQTQSRDIVVANLRAAAECGRLRQSFENAGVPLLFLKGVTLGALAYRDPYLKMGVDIDLLVEPNRLAEAANLLRTAGYTPTVPDGADDGRIARWHATRKESVWIGGKAGFQIDLHTRLADHPSILRGLTASSPSQLVPVATGISLPTLTNDELFAYLCVHGASSAWFRLKWITDLAACLRPKGTVEIERLYERSQRLGAGRAAGQALLLADRLYSVDIGSNLAGWLVADPVTRWLAGLAEDQLYNPTEPTERFLGTAMIHISQLGLRAGWRFKASEAARQLRDMIGRNAP